MPAPPLQFNALPNVRIRAVVQDQAGQLGAAGAGLSIVAKPIEPKEKPIFNIYFALVTDGPIPGRHNLLHVSARFSPEITWSRNILPQNGAVRQGARLTSELIVQLQRGAIPIRQAMTELVEWLDRFKGFRLPVTSGLGFWHLLYHMHELGDKMPFVSNPIDVNSFYAGSQGDLQRGKVVKGKEPSSVMAQRLAIVAEACEQGGKLQW